MTSKKLSWVAQRRGKHYCSPACGGNCLYDDYLNARLQAVNTAVELGKEWKVIVHENLGWHWKVCRNYGGLHISIGRSELGYWCMIGDGPGMAHEHMCSLGTRHKTAKLALKSSIRVLAGHYVLMRQEMANIEQALNDYYNKKLLEKISKV